jgi:hypothetical protein
MRLIRLTWPFPFLVRLGWATARQRNPDPACAHGRVYFLRGQGVIFSRGFGRMCAELRRAGWWAEDLRCVGDLWLRRHLEYEHKAGRLHGPVVLVGHSCGGRSALHVANYLEPHGIAIRLIICVDVAFPYPVAGNVAHAVHLYRCRLRLYPAGPLQGACGSRTVIENVDLDGAESPLDERWLHHLNITARPSVQAWILGRIFATQGHDNFSLASRVHEPAAASHPLRE